ncbi:MAG: hypothetical protein ACU0BF_02670 [Paracoccaceae bacterium]
MSITPDIRFVVLSAARSGTTVLTSSLDTHPDIYCHREAMRDGAATTIKAEFRALHDVEAMRRDDPAGLARALLAFSPGPRCVGFKLFRGQSAPALDAVMADPGVHKVVLERMNYLASYSSQLLARATGISHARGKRGQAYAEVEKPKVPFDAGRFKRRVTAKVRGFAAYRERSVGPLMDLRYDEIGPEAFSRVVSFLGLPPAELEVSFRKMNDADILSRFRPEDHDTIRRTLDEIGHPEWVREGA